MRPDDPAVKEAEESAVDARGYRQPKMTAFFYPVKKSSERANPHKKRKVPAVKSTSRLDSFMDKNLSIGNTNDKIPIHPRSKPIDVDETDPSQQLVVGMSQAQYQSSESDYGSSDIDNDPEIFGWVERAEKTHDRHNQALNNNLRLVNPPNSVSLSGYSSPTSPNLSFLSLRQTSTSPASVHQNALLLNREVYGEPSRKEENEIRGPATGDRMPHPYIPPSATQTTSPVLTPSRTTRYLQNPISQIEPEEKGREENRDTNEDNRVSSPEINRHMRKADSIEINDPDINMSPEFNSSPSRAQTVTTEHGLVTPKTGNLAREARFKKIDVGAIPMRGLGKKKGDRKPQFMSMSDDPFASTSTAVQESYEVNYKELFKEVLYKELMDALKDSNSDNSVDFSMAADPPLISLSKHKRSQLCKIVEMHGAKIQADIVWLKQEVEKLRRERDALAQWRENATLKAFETLVYSIEEGNGASSSDGAGSDTYHVE